MSGSMNILIVDDQFTNRYLLEKLLTGYGYFVISAEDGVEALEKLKTNSIELIISDILLPKMDGFQLCRKIKSETETRHIPFIFYTAAYTDKKDRDLAESLGADRYIIKPTDPVDFIAIIRELVDTYPQISEEKSPAVQLEEEQYLAEHNSRLISQLEKKLGELEKLNQALTRSEARYKNLFENANDAIILHKFSDSGKPEEILEVNEVACSLLGYTRDEILTKKMNEIESPKFLDYQSSLILDLSSSCHITYEGECIAKSDQVIPVEISTHIYTEDGDLLCLSIYRDISLRKQAMEELSRAIKQINQNIYQMATIGDMIRNPLGIILATCDGCNGDKFTEIADAVQRIDAFIEKLDLGWVESEKIRAFLQKQYSIGV